MPSTFQRLVDRVLDGLKWTTCLVYLDDVVVFGKAFEGHFERLEHGMALEKDSLVSNADVKKCIFAALEITHLGHVVDCDGFRPEATKVKALIEFKVDSVLSLRGFLRIASFYHSPVT